MLANTTVVMICVLERVMERERMLGSTERMPPLVVMVESGLKREEESGPIVMMFVGVRGSVGSGVLYASTCTLV